MNNLIEMFSDNMFKRWLMQNLCSGKANKRTKITIRSNVTEILLILCGTQFDLLFNAFILSMNIIEQGMRSIKNEMRY